MTATEFATLTRTATESSRTDVDLALQRSHELLGEIQTDFEQRGFGDDMIVALAELTLTVAELPSHDVDRRGLAPRLQELTARLEVFMADVRERRGELEREHEALQRMRQAKTSPSTLRSCGGGGRRSLSSPPV